MEIMKGVLLVLKSCTTQIMPSQCPGPNNSRTSVQLWSLHAFLSRHTHLFAIIPTQPGPGHWEAQVLLQSSHDTNKSWGDWQKLCWVMLGTNHKELPILPTHTGRGVPPSTCPPSPASSGLRSESWGWPSSGHSRLAFWKLTFDEDTDLCQATH